jgi:hypothetical protein
MPRIDSYDLIGSVADDDLLLISDTSANNTTNSVEISSLASHINIGKQNQLTLTTTGTSGPATLTGATLNIPQYSATAAGTVTQITTTAPITGGTITTTGTIGITQASGSSDGYLSSADWSTFNNKSTFDGQYSSLTGAPTLAAVATSGAYSDLSGTPTLATVATSGSYNDLSDKPTIPTVPTNIVETVNTTDGTFINLTPNAQTDGDVTVTADLSATGTANNTTFLRGDNTWAVPSGGSGGVTFDYTDNSTNLILGESLTFGVGKSGNVGLGDLAFENNTVSSTNTGIGFKALRYNVGGAGSNTALGAQALEGVSTTTGYYNTAVGARAGRVIGSGYNNVFIGYDAGDNVTNGRDNTSIGAFSGGGITVGIENTIVGSVSANGVQSSKNVVIGNNAANTTFTGNNNIIIGYNAEASGSNAANEITIGDANITALRLPGLQTSASDGDVLTYSSSSQKITLQPSSGGGGGSGALTAYEKVFTGSDLVNAFNGNLTDQVTLVSVPANNIIVVESFALTILGSSTGTTSYNSNNSLYVKRDGQTAVSSNFNCASINSTVLNISTDDFGVYLPMLTAGSFTRISPQWGGAGADLVLGPNTSNAVNITAGDRKVKISLTYRLVDVS